MTESNFQGFYTTDKPKDGDCVGCEHYDGKYCLFFYHQFDGKPFVPKRTEGGWCEFYESNSSN